MDQNRPLTPDPPLKPGGLSQVVPLLQVSNMARSLEYYREALGFDLADTWPEGEPPRWAHILREGIHFILTVDLGTGGRDFIAEKGNGVVLYLVTDQLEALYEELVERGALVVQDMVTFGGRTQFSVGDADGYVLAFSEPFAESR
jgi:uncharacterized glyoxalase superfamily protein PhnB